jgi:hypothetical protein
MTAEVPGAVRRTSQATSPAQTLSTGPTHAAAWASGFIKVWIVEGFYHSPLAAPAAGNE